jgi:hypothetical protein
VSAGGKCFLRPTFAFENQFVFFKDPIAASVINTASASATSPPPSLLLDAPKTGRRPPLAGLRLGGPHLCRHYGHTIIIIPVHIVHAA